MDLTTSTNQRKVQKKIIWKNLKGFTGSGLCCDIDMGSVDRAHRIEPVCAGKDGPAARTTGHITDCWG